MASSEKTLSALADISDLQESGRAPGETSDYNWTQLVTSGHGGGPGISTTEEKRDIESYVDLNLNNIFKDYGISRDRGSGIQSARTAGYIPSSIEGSMMEADRDMITGLESIALNMIRPEIGYDEPSYTSTGLNLAGLHGTYRHVDTDEYWAGYYGIQSYGRHYPSRSGSGVERSNQISLGHKNYAVIVGINGYSDRRDLHACVNDANAIASILNAYGYEVIKLTDETRDKPTKHNILEGALAEICTKQDRGNVIIYFSGHAFRDDKGDFYLVPQDGNGETSSYIAAEDIDRYIRNLKNLAIIIDACNSGGFDGKIGSGQMAIMSSKEDEPSNEEWPGQFSVFTSQLCGAIKEEHLKNGDVQLQRCFYMARNNTIRWSDSHLLRQTPEMLDRTSGSFSLR